MTKHSKIVYLSNTRLPTEKAHGLALMKLCEAFVKEGCDVEVIAPRRSRHTEKDAYVYYGIKKIFPIIFLPTLDWIDTPLPQKATFFLQLFSFSLYAFFYCLFRYHNQRVVFFSHDHIPLWFASWLSRSIYYDVHHFPDQNLFYRRVLKRACGFSVQTKWKQQALYEKFGIPQDRIIYWPNGTDVAQFAVPISKNEARSTLGLPQKGRMVLYAGHLYEWKGVDTLVRSFPQLSRETFLYIVGGHTNDVVRLKTRVRDVDRDRVVFVPFQDHNRIPLWLRAADVLVLPNTAQQKVSLFYTSPMKLFEYMASSTPIVASDIPSVREILTEENAYFATADDPNSFGRRINFVLAHEREAGEKGKQAQRDVQHYTWEKRARMILEHMEQICR